jgi:tetrahydromethanopterin S-methyltransferase subunit G
MADMEQEFRKLNNRLDAIEKLVKKAITTAEQAKREAKRAQN